VPRRLGDPAVLCASPDKLIKALNWNPRGSDLRNIVHSAWEWKQRSVNADFTTEPELI
jgi:UDP-glucose 4-epimerase